MLDGTIDPVDNGYYAVGTTYCWGPSAPYCQPGPDSPASRIAELWVR